MRKKVSPAVDTTSGSGKMPDPADGGDEAGSAGIHLLFDNLVVTFRYLKQHVIVLNRANQKGTSDRKSSTVSNCQSVR